MNRKSPSRMQVAWTAGRLAGRRVFRRKASLTDTVLGEKLTEQLDDMKGLAMKMGQIISYMDIPLPDDVLNNLAKLQRGIEGMPEEQTRQLLSELFGEDIEEIFDEFDMRPIAAASIGQVHRARLRGRDVAVKLQYPDVAFSFQKDLSAINKIASMVSVVSAVGGKSIVAELSERLNEECNYEREAQMQRAFSTAFAGQPGIRIPKIFSDMCFKNLLVSEWIEGQSLEELLLLEDRERINKAAGTLFRFSYDSLLNFSMIQADPHPGNFIFQDDAVCFLDFGCVRSFSEEFVDAIRRNIIAVRNCDMENFRQSTIDMGVVG